MSGSARGAKEQSIAACAVLSKDHAKLQSELTAFGNKLGKLRGIVTLVASMLTTIGGGAVLESEMLFHYLNTFSDLFTAQVPARASQGDKVSEADIEVENVERVSKLRDWLCVLSPILHTFCASKKSRPDDEFQIQLKVCLLYTSPSPRD